MQETQPFKSLHRKAPVIAKATARRGFERDGLSDTDGPQPGGIARLRGVRVADVLPGGGGAAISAGDISNVAHVTGGGGAVANCGLVKWNEAIIC